MWAFLFVSNCDWQNNIDWKFCTVLVMFIFKCVLIGSVTISRCHLIFAQFNSFMYCIRVGIVPCLFDLKVWYNVTTVLTMHMLCLCVSVFAISRAYGKLNILNMLKCWTKEKQFKLYICGNMCVGIFILSIKTVVD